VENQGRALSLLKHYFLGMLIASAFVWLMMEAFAPPRFSYIPRDGVDVGTDGLSAIGLRNPEAQTEGESRNLAIPEPGTPGDAEVLEAGDILLGRCRLSPVPSLNPFMSWTHAAMYAGDETIIVAGNPETGVVERRLESWMFPEMTWVCYVRVQGADKATKRRAVEFAREKVGQPYDINWLSKQLDGDSWYCSELIWAAYHHASDGSIDLVSKLDIFGVAPDEIYMHEATVEVGGHYEKRPDTIFSLFAKVSLICMLFCAGALLPHTVV